MLSRLPVLLQCSRGLVATVATAPLLSAARQQPSSQSFDRSFLTTSPSAAAAGEGEGSSTYGQLSEEQESMFQMAREFAKEKMLPHAAAWEEDKASLAMQLLIWQQGARAALLFVGFHATASVPCFYHHPVSDSWTMVPMETRCCDSTSFLSQLLCLCIWTCTEGCFAAVSAPP